MVNINNYNVLLGLDFLMKIGTIVGVEKGVIHVWNGLSVVMEVLPLNVINMFQMVTRPEEAYLDKFSSTRVWNMCMQKKQKHGLPKLLVLTITMMILFWKKT
jgi:hypothetical protein